MDNITTLEILNEMSAPAGYSFKKFDHYVLFYRFFYEESNANPFIESINIDKDLRDKLHYKGSAISLPTWFKDINRYKMTSVSTVGNFVSYMKSVAENIPPTILDEIERVVYNKPEGRSTYSPDVLRFSLMQRFTSRQAYSLLLNEFPLPSLSLLKKLFSGGIDCVKAIQLLIKEEKVSADCVLMLDGMYLQKSTEYPPLSITYANGEFYIGILVSMIIGLTKSICNM